MAIDIDGLRDWVRDEPVRAAYVTASVARMQVASYQVLKTLAEAAGEHEIASSCEQLRVEQQEFAEWLDEQIPQLLTTMTSSCVAKSHQ